MFSSSKPNYTKLRTNIRLCINRLKLLEKKKTELALKARKEIADYVSAGKDDRARIRVEHIVREDYLVEAMEIVEMFCDLILARYGMIEKMKELDPGLEEAIATLFWVTPRLSADVPEFKEVSKQLALKYGKEYADMCRSNGFENVNEKVMHKLSVAAPPRSLIENYMIEITRTYKVPFEPDHAALVDLMGELNVEDMRQESSAEQSFIQHDKPNVSQEQKIPANSEIGSAEPHSFLERPLKSHHILARDHFPSGLRVALLNVRSLTSHYLELATLLRNGPVDVLAVCETWLDQSITDEEISIEGYCILRKDRNREGGGVLFYISESLKYSTESITIGLECVSLNIIDSKNNPEICFVNIYRPPRLDFKEFEQKLKQLVSKLYSKYPRLVILGDFNCDLFKSTANSKRLVLTMNSVACRNVIMEPTRVTSSSSTCIDLIFISRKMTIVQAGVCNVGISDHFMPYSVLQWPGVGEATEGKDSIPLLQTHEQNIEHDASEASDLIDLGPNPQTKPPGGGNGGGGGGGTALGFEGIGSQSSEGACGFSSDIAAPEKVNPQVPGSGVFPDTEPPPNWAPPNHAYPFQPPPKTIPPYQPPDTMPAHPPSYTSSVPGPQGYPSAGPQGQMPPPTLPSHPPNAGCNMGMPGPVPNFGASDGSHPAVSSTPSLPAYNDVFKPPSTNGAPPPSSGASAPRDELGFPNLPDVPGLPSVPAGSVGVDSAGGDDVDFDDLTKRFEQLKKHK